MSTARVWCLARHFDGAAKLSDFRLEQQSIDAVQDGQVKLKAEVLTVDPYMKVFASQLQEGDVMMGAQVAKVVESKNKEFPVGRYALVSSGWRDLTVCDPSRDRPGDSAVVPLPDPLPVEPSHYVGVVGMTGLTAYFTVHKLLKPQSGDVVVVSAAAGAVGSMVGQIAKIAGARVIGYAGSDHKVTFLKEKLNFDEAFNYKSSDLAETLKAAAPGGVNAYYDGVGGKFASTVADHMAMNGRIAVIGAISTYNSAATEGGPYSSLQIITKQLHIAGWMYFAQNAASDEMNEARQKLAQWLSEGKLHAEETVVDGFENMPQAFIDMMDGKNTGKMVVKA